MKPLASIFSALVGLGFIAMAALWLMSRPVPVSPPGPGAPPPILGKVDRIIVDKAARQMALIQNGTTVRKYRIALGFEPVGDKVRQGDGKTPEGVFRISYRNEASSYHLSLRLDYPQAEDRARAAAAGYDPGGDIMIHGQPNAAPDAMVLPGDWTAGCIALSNAEMREVWAATDKKTLVEIRP